MSRKQQMSKGEAAKEPLHPSLVKARLKAERVQEALRKLPGWRLLKDRIGIDRVRQFDSGAAAEAYAGFACRLAAAQQQPVTVGLSGTKVVVTLHGHPVRGRSGGLTEAVFGLAAELG